MFKVTNGRVEEMKTVKELLKMLRPFDYVLLLALIIFSFLPSLVFWSANATQEGQNVYAVISIDGEEVDRFLLTDNREHELITYHPSPDQYNIVEIDGEKIRNKEDNSPEQVAVKQGWVQYPGETSINIPHRFLIEIISEEPTDSEIDIIAKFNPQKKELFRDSSFFHAINYKSK